MSNKYPTTCTTCRAPFDAGFFVVSDQEIRLCPACEEASEWRRELGRLMYRLEASHESVRRWECRIRKHKAAHPPLVVTGQGEYKKEYHG